MKVKWLGGPKDGAEMQVRDDIDHVVVRLGNEISAYSDELSQPLSEELSIMTVPIDRERKLLLWYEGEIEA